MLNFVWVVQTCLIPFNQSWAFLNLPSLLKRPLIQLEPFPVPVGVTGMGRGA